MKHVLVRAAAVLLCGSWSGCAALMPRDDAGRARREVALRISLASTEARADYEKSRDELGRQLFVCPDVLVSERDVWRAAAMTNGGRGIVRLDLSAMGSDRLARATVGAERLAIFLDGRLVLSPRLAGPLTNGRILLDAGFSAKRAAEIAAALDGR